MTFAVPSELRAWVRPGLAGAIAVAEGPSAVEIVRFWALRFREGSNILDIYVQRSAAERALAMLAGGARAALNAIEVETYRSRQFKGDCIVSQDHVDGTFLAACIAAQQRAFGRVGLPENAAERMLAQAGSPAMVGLSLAVDAIFDQSPKRGAGAPL